MIGELNSVDPAAKDVANIIRQNSNWKLGSMLGSSFYYQNLKEKLYNCNIEWAASNDGCGNIVVLGMPLQDTDIQNLESYTRLT